MIANYHTHTIRCNHAEGTDEEYIQAALAQGIKILGFSDHAPWPTHPLEHQRIRMQAHEFMDYVESLSRLKRQYSGKLKVLLGLESEYYPDRMEFMKGLLVNTPLDYLIFGNHFLDYEANGHYFGRYGNPSRLLEDYEKTSIAGLESGLFSLFAHPDLFVRSLEAWTEEAAQMSRRILQKAKDLNIPVEYNLGGARMKMRELSYPYKPFWELAGEIGNTVVIGIDAHSPSDFDDLPTYDEALRVLKECGITPVDEIPLRTL